MGDDLVAHEAPIDEEILCVARRAREARRRHVSRQPDGNACGLHLDGRLREVVSARCMREFGLSRGLPSECAFDIRTSVGRRTVYGPQCLSDYGYRVASIRY